MNSLLSDYGFNFPLCVNYKNSQFIAYAYTKTGMLKLLKLEMVDGKKVLTKYTGTPKFSTVGITRGRVKMETVQFNGHTYFKLFDLVYSCSTGDRIVQVQILDLFMKTPIPVPIPVPIPKEITMTKPSSESKNIRRVYNILRGLSGINVEVTASRKMLIKMNGYIPHLLLDMPGDFIKVTITCEGKDFDFQEVLQTMIQNKDHIEWGDKVEDKLHLTIFEHAGKWCSRMEGLGIKVDPAKKGQKRAGQVYRGYLMCLKTKRRLVVRFIDGKKELYDGAIFISKKFADEIITATVKYLESIGDLKSARRVKQLGFKSNIFNGRAWIPGVAYGFLKGQFFINYEQVEDIVTHRCNFKGGVTVEGDITRVGMDPQRGKLYADSNKQAINNFPFAYGITKDNKLGLLIEFLKGMLAEKFTNLQSGKIEEDFGELAELVAKGIITQGETTRQRFNAIEVMKRFGTLKLTSGLLGQVSKVGILSQVDRKYLDLNIRIPGATYCQTVSNSVAKMMGVKIEIEKKEVIYSDSWLEKLAYCGLPIEVKKGEIRYNDKYRIFIINDQDYLDNLLNHGGPDHDDKFCQMFFLYKGEISIFMYRNPSNVGEYNVLRFVGDMPKGVELNPVVFPDVLPHKVTDAMREGFVPYTVPKTEHPTVIHSVGTLAYHVMREGTSPGAMICVVNFFNHIHSSVQTGLDVTVFNKDLPKTEEIVDTFTQGSDQVAQLAIYKQARKVVMDLVADPEVKMDPEYYYRVEKILPEEMRLTEERNPEKFIRYWYVDLVIEAERLIKESIEKIDKEIDTIRIRFNFVAWIESKGVKFGSNEIATFADKYKDASRELAGEGLIEHKLENAKLKFKEGVEYCISHYKMERKHAILGFAAAINQHTKKSSGLTSTDWILTSKEYFEEYVDALEEYVEDINAQWAKKRLEAMELEAILS